ncbi:MAG: pyrimidine 5'-nucleotidase [Pseudomonadota bacterium]|nr:pyrimidine 5'-nucleotidase [Pseudomonadota bacterium]
MKLNTIKNAECWIFDLDNTLYPASTNLFDQIDKRMCSYIARFLKLDHSEAYNVQKSYFREHGTSLKGMMENHAMEPDPFLEYVHDIDLSCVLPDGTMGEALKALPGRKIVFTNAAKGYAKNVLKQIGIERHFEDIFDIVDASYDPKPSPQIYKKFVERYQIDPKKSVMVEDIARNLVPAINLGMTSVWVVTNRSWASNQTNGFVSDFTVDNLSSWLSIVAKS